MVAMETTSFAGNALRSWSSFLWKFSHIRIWMNRSNVFPLAGPSKLPKADGHIPCLCISDTGATPFAAFVLEAMQWATDAPCFARISTSCSVVRMLWAGQRIQAEDTDMLHKLNGRHIILFPQLGHLVVHLRHMERKYGSRLYILLIGPL